MSQSIIETVETLVTPIIEERNLSLVDIEYVREGKDMFLRIFIDKEGGVDLIECSYVSEQLSESLDKHDPIKDPYFLEVSSPGAERPLKSKQDFINHIGNNVYVTLYVHIDSAKEYEGTLLAFEDDIATIEYKFKHTKKQVEIPYDKIAKARLSVML